MIGRIADVCRFGLYLKSADRGRLVLLKDLAEETLRQAKEAGEARGVQLQFDFDPIRGF